MQEGARPRLEWDEYNVEHLAQHGITVHEVEDLFDGLVIRQHRRTDAPDRFTALGRTAGGRYLVLICQQKARDLIRPFTGWDMAPHERRSYGRQIGR
jgi:uncharacterized DUF497 family protein